MVIAISLLLGYMVTAAVFESLVQPLCVLFTVPLALIGVYLIFFYTEASFTREAYIGVIMMFGIVVNNAILLVDHVNGVRRRLPELALDDAIVRGTVERVRPILMTTIVLVAAMLPVAFGGGPGAANRATMAVVIVGGQSMCLLITLLVVPVFYSLFDDATQWLGKRFGGAAEKSGAHAATAAPAHGGTR